MAFDETLAARIRDALARRRNVKEMTMFGCICFFSNGNALVGVGKARLIARLGPDEGEAALREPHVRAFDITRRPMKNWVAVEPEGVDGGDQLSAWVERATIFVQTLPKKCRELSNVSGIPEDDPDPAHLQPRDGEGILHRLPRIQCRLGT